MTEKQLQTKLIKILEKNGWYVIKFNDRYRAGIPDMIAIKCGRTVWIELKSDTGKLSGPQERTLADLAGHGAEVFIIKPKNIGDLAWMNNY